MDLQFFSSSYVKKEVSMREMVTVYVLGNMWSLTFDDAGEMLG